MHPTLALLLCLAFVVSLLKLDYRIFKAQSMASWIPTLWMLYCASKPFPYWFSSRQVVGVENLSAAIIEGSPMDRNFLLVLIAVGLVILVRRKIDWRQVIIDNRWLLLLFLYMLVSISWSDYPFVSLKRWFKASGSIVMALVVLTGPSPREEIESILRRIVYILIPFSALLVKYYPQFGMRFGRYSGAPEWVGVTLGKNTLGALCMVSALFLIWEWAKRRKQTEISSARYVTMANVVVLGLTFWLLRGPGGAYSATSLVVLIVGLATIFMLRRLKSNVNLRVMSCVFLLVAGLLYFFINPLNIVISLTGRNETLTGRDEIWDKLIPVAMENPVIGVGYGGYWTKPLVFGKLTINEAHNGYLDIFIELGAIGLILLAIVIVDFFKKSIDVFKYDREWGSFLFAFLIISLLYNITESAFLKSTIFLWNVLIMLMVACPRKIGIIPSKVVNQHDSRSAFRVAPSDRSIRSAKEWISYDADI